MPHARRRFGDSAEHLAERYLVEQGYVIRDRQYLTRSGEIDLVAEIGNEVVFVEVKARHTDEFGYPEAAVTPSKLRKITQTAAVYLRQYKLEDRDYRIDVIAIEHQFLPPRITHFEGVS